MRKKKSNDKEALHDATHGQFGEEPRPGPVRPAFDEKEKLPQNPHEMERLKAARKKSRTI